ncbi:metallophosphoesterase family protein [Paenibacillus protaetiae]|uniref:Phosphoesterase n=1 Tax=Paenibacillus protaetiae TaxID=2509456 RepID=A0A4P6EY68_9BACL|nr:metallophosphoesterase family protein [Paenibacillus protaetiae]QAY68350.1 metallophosphoesterase [Paenibacillus protaetiae]
MKIVIVSDTHMPRMAKSLPAALVQQLEGADLILHAGDWTTLLVYHELARYAPVKGVAGNNDGEALVAKFGLKRIVNAGGKRFGLVHGHGPVRSRTALQTALAAFDGEQVDAVIFGHSHVPYMKRHEGVLLFNPGSPTAKRKQPLYSFGVWQLNGGELRARHVFFADKS